MDKRSIEFGARLKEKEFPFMEAEAHLLVEVDGNEEDRVARLLALISQYYIDLERALRAMPSEEEMARREAEAQDAASLAKIPFSADKVRMDGAPVMLQVPWGVSFPMLPGVPLPARITVEVCEPLDWSHHGPDAVDDPHVLDACYDEVTSVMQGTLDALAAENPQPLLTRFRARKA